MVQRKVTTIKRVIRDNDERLVRALVGRLNEDQDDADRPSTPTGRLRPIDDGKPDPAPRAVRLRTAMDLTVARLGRYVRRARVRRALSAIQPPAWSARRAAPGQTDDDMPERDRLERIRDAINDLPVSCRAAFVMHRFEGRSYGEIAAALGVSRTVVENYVARALDMCQSSTRH